MILSISAKINHRSLATPIKTYEYIFDKYCTAPVQEIIVSINCMNCKKTFSVLLQSGYLCADLKNSLHASLIPSRGKNLLAWYWRWKKVPPKDYNQPELPLYYYFFSGVVVALSSMYTFFWVKTMWSNVRKTSDGTSHKMTQHFCWCHFWVCDAVC